MDEARFVVIATQELSTIAEALESTDREGVLDIEFLDGILSIKLEDGGEYVINKHNPTRKIWASSPISGASYYVYDEKTNNWHSTKIPTESPRTMLSEELKARIGIVIKW